MTAVFNLHVGLTARATTHAYVVGNRVSNSANAYQCITAGTSSSTAGPTTTASDITDGTVHWKWLSAIDYSTLTAAAAGLPGSFTQPIVWQLWNDGTVQTTNATASYLTLSGHTTTTTNSLTITCAPGESFRDTLKNGNTALAFSTSTGVSFSGPTVTPAFGFNIFDITDANVILDGLQFLDPNTTSGCSLFQSNGGATGLVLKNCIFDGTAQAGGAFIIGLFDTFSMTNCLVVDRQPSGGGQVAVDVGKAGNIVNCTGIGINTPAATPFILSNSTTASANVVRNCAVFGYPNGVAQSGVAAANVTIDHCAVSASLVCPAFTATDGGSNLTSQTASTNFVSTTTDFRLKLGASCANAGVTDTTDIPLSTDIVGLTRPEGPAWDIGAYELPSLRLRGISKATGKSSLSLSYPSKGFSRSQGKTNGAVSRPLSGRGVSISRGMVANIIAKPIVASGKAAVFGSPYTITNVLPNSDETGAVVGTPGTLPTGWSLSNSGGLSVAVTAIGTDATTGYNYVRLRFSGTGNGSGDCNLEFVNPSVLAKPSWNYTLAVYASIFAGSLTNISTLGLITNNLDASNNYLSGALFSFVTLTGTVAQYRGDFTTSSSAARLSAGFSLLGPTNGGAVDITIQFELPELLKAAGDRAGMLVSLPLVSRGFATGDGVLLNASVAPLVGKGRSLSRGVLVLALTGNARGRSVASGKTGAVYLTPPLQNGGAIKGKALSSAVATMVGTVAFAAAGLSLSQGRSIYSSNSDVNLRTLGLSQSFGRSAAATQTTALLGASQSNVSGASRISASEPIVGTGRALSAGRAIAALIGFLTGRGRSEAFGKFNVVNTLTAPLAAAGVGKTTGRLSGAYTTALIVRSPGKATGKTSATVAMPLGARGIAAGTGNIGASGIQFLSARGLSLTAGRVAATVLALPLVGAGMARGAGRNSIVQTLPIAAGGFATGSGVVGAAANLILRGRGVSRAQAVLTGSFAAALTGQGVAKSSGVAVRLAQSAALRGRATSQAGGVLQTPTQQAGPKAAGQARSSGMAASFSFAPVALVGSGMARAAGAGRNRVAMPLLGTTLGFSAGRCAATAAITLRASGRTQGTGHFSSTASASAALSARGSGVVHGRFYQVLDLVRPYGQARGFGKSLISTYYNLTPDAIGPRLTNTTTLAAFDSMDIGDVDVFSFDWSQRASVQNDPIISATVTAMPMDLPVGPVVIVGNIVQVHCGATQITETFSLRCSVILRSGRRLNWSSLVPVEDF